MKIMSTRGCDPAPAAAFLDVEITDSLGDTSRRQQRNPQKMTRITILSLAIVVVACVACSNRNNVQCEQNSNCDLSGGGVCTSSPAGNQWCAYPDPACPSGLRYSDEDVGDGVGGQCTGASGTTDAGVDAIVDANPGAVISIDQPAALVLGQESFTTADFNHGGPSAASLGDPESISASEDGSFWVFDTANSRALQWTSAPQANFAASARVIGHLDFTTIGAATPAANSVTNDQGGISATNGKIVIADGNRNRVLIWNQSPSANGANADIVLGQAGFTTTTLGTTASTLNLPGAVWTDGVRLVVADVGNNRILVWNSFPVANKQAADLVLGQSGFTTAVQLDPPTASSMYAPRAVYSVGTRLFVADTNNSRVLVWNTFPTTNGQAADLVIGQADFVTRGSGVGPTRLNGPTGIAVVANNLFVVDQNNRRVVMYSPIPSTSGASASSVLGQPDFVSNVAGTSSTGMNLPSQATILDHTLYVTDSFNDRVLGFGLNL